MMEICSKNHDEIIFDCRDCPLCKANQTIKELEADIFSLTDKVLDFEKERGEA